MAQDRAAQIRELLKLEQSIQFLEGEGDEPEQRQQAYEYRNLFLKLKNMLQTVLAEPTLTLLNKIDESIHTVTTAQKTRSQLHGLVPDIEDALEKYEKIYGNDANSIEAYKQNGAYSTPYLDLMIRAINELEINNDNQPKKLTIEEWFKNQTYFKVSPKEIDKLASFIRLPEMKTGGNRKIAQKKDGTL